VGYADVHVVVRDINDNSPVFPSQISGEVDENRDPESFVMTVEAMDLDDPATPNAQLGSFYSQN
jgi:cadherin 17 (LI cadherin)